MNHQALGDIDANKVSLLLSHCDRDIANSTEERGDDEVGANALKPPLNGTQFLKRNSHDFFGFVINTQNTHTPFAVFAMAASSSAMLFRCGSLIVSPVNLKSLKASDESSPSLICLKSSPVVSNTPSPLRHAFPAHSMYFSTYDSITVVGHQGIPKHLHVRFLLLDEVSA